MFSDSWLWKSSVIHPQGGQCLFNPWCICCSIPPLTSWVGPLSACVRATAEQQPVEVFSAGAAPGICDSPVDSDLQKEPNVGISAIADLLRSQPSSASAIGWQLWHTNFSLLLQRVFDGKRLCIPSLAIKLMCFVPTTAGGKKAEKIWQFPLSPVVFVDSHLL